MKYTIMENSIAYYDTDTLLIEDTQSALDFIGSAQYETGCRKFIVNKCSLPRDFFILSTGLAGEILQKFVTYQVKFAIVGDYTKYTSKPLHDFIFESNKGNDIFFVSTLEEAVQKLNN